MQLDEQQVIDSPALSPAMNLGTANMDTAVNIAIPKGLEALAERYLNTRLRELPVFQSLLERAEFDEIRRLSHNLKGTGTSYGFPDITRLGAAIERASKDQDSVDVGRQMSSLSNYVNSAMAQLGFSR